MARPKHFSSISTASARTHDPFLPKEESCFTAASGIPRSTKVLSLLVGRAALILELEALRDIHVAKGQYRAADSNPKLFA